MLYEIAQALVHRIMRDKILLALVVIGILAIFVGGMNSHDEPPVASKAPAPPEDSPAAPSAPQPQALDPNLATDFTKWWLSLAMDYSAKTAQQSHQQASGWITADALSAFQTAFWSPETANGILSGRMVAGFQPTSVQAKAINPDGSVVVGVIGTLVSQSNGQPVTHQIMSDFLIRKEKAGLRLAGVYNEVVPIASGAPVY